MERWSARVWAIWLVLLMVPIAPAQADGPPADPTTDGRAIIGWEPGMAPDLHVGDRLSGFLVVATEPRGPFTVVEASDLEDVRSRLGHRASVAYIEDDGLVTTADVPGPFTPNDELYSTQYGPQQMGAPAVWGVIGLGSPSVTVAVLDTGIRYDHEDFDASRLLTGYDYINNDSDPWDDCDHGTHVSGTIAATTNNDVGVAGVSQATLLPMKVLGPDGPTCSGPWSAIAQAIYDATDQGADIISMSLGSSGSSSTGHNAVQYAAQRGVVLVAAAGNGGQADGVDYPGAFDEVIAVANVNSDGVRASSSDRGPEVEISAAGTGIISTVDNHDHAYATMSGTSMATPHVAGAIALAKTCAPAASAAELRQALQESAEDRGDPGRDTSYGFGLTRADGLLAWFGCMDGEGRDDPPQLHWTASEVGQRVDGDATATFDPDTEDLQFLWDWGDGNTSTGVTASHQYDATGERTVTLYVSDNTTTLSEQTTVFLVDVDDPPSDLEELRNGEESRVQTTFNKWNRFFTYVPGDADTFTVHSDAPACRVRCAHDVDLYVRYGENPTRSRYDCGATGGANDKTCLITDPAPGWWFIGIHAALGEPAVKLTASHDGSNPNHRPVALFSAATAALRVDLDATASYDVDDDPLTFWWDFGDGNSASGAIVSHEYASAGTFTITLTARDPSGAKGSASTIVEPIVDPDPSIPTIPFGEAYSFPIGDGAQDFKVYVPPGDERLRFRANSPGCGNLCAFDISMYIQYGERATRNNNICASENVGDDEACSWPRHTEGWWYIRIRHIVGERRWVDLEVT